MGLRALVVDDEELARRRVLDFLAHHHHISCIGECGTATGAIETILRECPDVVFLDIQMPELDGFAVLDAIRDEHLPAIIFTTAHDEHAIRAFDVRAVDYLLKPFSKARFDDAISRLKIANSVALKTEVRSLLKAVRTSQGYPEKMAFKVNGRIVIVSTDKIEWFQAERDYVRLHLQPGSLLIRETMTNIHSKLCDQKFIRIHRSAIVNVDHVVELRPIVGGEYSVKLRNGEQLTMSRNHRNKLSELLPQMAR